MGRKVTELIYLDHNHLKRTGKNPFRLTMCKFWQEDILRLQSLVDVEKKTFEQAVLNSLSTYEPEFTWYAYQNKPVKYLDKRGQAVLDHVKDCITKHGAKYVFDE